MTKERMIMSVQTVKENIAILESQEPQDAGYYLQLEHEKFVLNALEKQIPKKPITRNKLVKTERGYALLDENEQEYCPVCNYFVQPPCEKYCSHCGQALDWGEEE